MNVLYVGPLSPGGTCFSRLLAMREVAPSLHIFDSDPFFKKMGKWERLAEQILFFGPHFRAANKALLQLFLQCQPDIVWVDKGFWIWPSTLQKIRQMGTFLVQHNTDALNPRHPLVRWMYVLMRSTLSYYHIYFTTNLLDFSAISGRRSLHVELTHLGYDHTRFTHDPLPENLQRQWATDILFVGHYEPRTELGILSLIKAELSVSVYGYGWKRARFRNRLQKAVHFRQLTNQEYVCALKSAKIGLCFVSELNGNQTAGRSFEIPACGTFLLAMRTPQHGACYIEGEEAEFFSSNEELVEKARYYLGDDHLRHRIAQRGHERCVNSDYSWARYLRDDWTKVIKLYSERKKK